MSIVPPFTVSVVGQKQQPTPWFLMEGANGFSAQVQCITISGGDSASVEVIVAKE